MSIQVTLLTNLLYFQMALVIFLLQPALISIKIWTIKKYNFITTATVLKHSLIGLYVVIGMMLLDSTYKWNKSESILLTYQNEKNFYICIFTLFLAIVLNKLCGILENKFKMELINKQAIKQNGNSRAFVSSVIEENKAEKERLENEIKKLKEELSKAKVYENDSEEGNEKDDENDDEKVETKKEDLVNKKLKSEKLAEKLASEKLLSETLSSKRKSHTFLNNKN
jgi:hypothetical protein